MILTHAHAQSPDNIFYLHIGDTSCRFACIERWNTVQREVQARSQGAYERTVIDPIHVKAIRQLVKDTVIKQVTFILLDTPVRVASAAMRLETDTVTSVPVIPMDGYYAMPILDKLDYAIRVEMTYANFIGMVTNGVELRNERQSYHLFIADVRYKCDKKEAYTDLFDKDFPRKLKCLERGGTAAIYLEPLDEYANIPYSSTVVARIQIKN